jgi:Leucine-rich repeat (LRR) protein
LNGRATTQVSGSDAEAIEEKKRTMLFREVERLVFSFKTLAKISNLDGLHNLTRLQLDNNRITKIEKITHLVWYTSS